MIEVNGGIDLRGATRSVNGDARSRTCSGKLESATNDDSPLDNARESFAKYYQCHLKAL